MGNMEKGLIKKKASYLLLPMKKDQTNSNCTKVYKWYPLVWEPDPSRSNISLGLVQQWMQHSCAGMLWSWHCKQEQQSTQPKHRPTVCTNGQRKREGTGSIFLSLLFFSSLSSLSTSCTSYMLIPRHTGHFLKCLWALPDTKCRKGESLVYFTCATLLYMWYI